MIPGLLVLSGLVFWLSKTVDENPVLQNLTTSMSRASESDPAAYDRHYHEMAHQLGLDKPLFYFNIQPAAYPDTLYRIVRPEQKEVLVSLLKSYGNWPAIQTYYNKVRSLAYQEEGSLGVIAEELLLKSDPRKIASYLKEQPFPEDIPAAFAAVTERKKSFNLLIPDIDWHGSDNQYHHWLKRTLSGNFGISVIDRRPVTEKIWPALRWTALFNGLAIFFAYLISIPVGMYTAWNAGGRADRFFNLFFLLLFSLPAFWMASMFSSFLTTPAFGIDLFPTIGVGDVSPEDSWWTYLSTRAYHLFLPVLCLTYPSLAFLTRQMRSAAKEEFSKTYVKTAKMKGRSNHQIIWSEVFRNASFPLITLLASLLPGLLAGSVLIELIFNLPGMGRLLIDATLASDWPVVMAITLLNGLFTVIGILLADLGYALADPRVRMGTKTDRS